VRARISAGIAWALRGVGSDCLHVSGLNASNGQPLWHAVEPASAPDAPLPASVLVFNHSLYMSKATHPALRVVGVSSGKVSYTRCLRPAGLFGWLCMHAAHGCALVKRVARVRACAVRVCGVVVVPCVHQTEVVPTVAGP
jgi:hypothetical protein